MTPDKIKEYIQSIIDGLSPLANKLGIAIEQVFTWAIKHNYAVAGSIIIGWLLSLIVVYLVYRLFKYGMGKDNPDSHYTRIQNSEGLEFASVIGAIGGGIFLIIMTVGLISDAVPRLIAPEWYATQDIIELVRSNNTP